LYLSIVSNWVWGLIDSYIGVVTAVDTLVLNLVGTIYPKALNERTSHLLETLKGPNAVVSWNRVVCEVDVGLGANLIAKKNVARVLQIIRDEVFVVLVDDGVYIEIGEVKLVAVVEKELSDVFGGGTGHCRGINALFDPKNIFGGRGWGIFPLKVQTKANLRAKPVADPEMFEVGDHLRELCPVLPGALDEGDRGHAHDLSAHANNLIKSVVEVADGCRKVDSIDLNSHHEFVLRTDFNRHKGWIRVLHYFPSGRNVFPFHRKYDHIGKPN
jgi:hypothetical protein